MPGDRKEKLVPKEATEQESTPKSSKDESAEALRMVAAAMQRRADHHNKTLGPAFDPTRESAAEYRQRLAASRPDRTNFESQEDYEEAIGYWQSHQGRILGLYAQANRANRPPPSDEPLVSEPDEEIESTPEGTNCTWDEMMRKGLPLTAREYLERDLGADPRKWAEYGRAEYLSDVPIEIRAEVRELVESLRPSFASTTTTAEGLSDLQKSPEDAAKPAIQADPETDARRTQ
jgi:hypothetical protein